LSISSDDVEVKAVEAMLLLEPDVPEGRECVEFDPLKEGTEEPALPRDEEEDVDAIGVDTLCVWPDVGKGRARVMGWDC
jgi:hypothetical protein